MGGTRLKVLVILFWTLAGFYLLFVVWNNTLPLNRNLHDPLVILNFIQRFSALLVFLLLTDQIVTGAFMGKITEKFGGWFYKLHITLGIVIYALILTHIFSYVLFLFIATNSINPFYFLTDICLLCDPKGELFISLGRISFWFVTFTVLVAKLRTTPVLRRNWRLFHFFNYFIFFLVAIHGYYTGTDMSSKLFLPVFVTCLVSVVVSLFYRLINIGKGYISIK